MYLLCFYSKKKSIQSMYVTYIKNYTYNNKNITILKRSLFKKSKNILSIFFRMISFSIIYRFDLKATSCSFY